MSQNSEGVFEEWRRATRRVKSEDWRPLRRFRWRQQLDRVLFYLQLSHQESGEVKAHVYLDDGHHTKSRLPAAFPVEDSTMYKPPFSQISR